MRATIAVDKEKLKVRSIDPEKSCKHMHMLFASGVHQSLTSRKSEQQETIDKQKV